MPRLPGPEALGNLPSMRSGAAPAQITSRDQIAEGAGRVGAGLVGISNEQREREDALQVAEADAALTTSLTEARRRFETDPNWQTFQPRFAEEAERARTEAASRITNPRVLERWQPRADTMISGSMDHIIGRQDRLRGEAEYDRLDRTLSQLGNAYATAPDDTSRQQIQRNIEETIELGRRTGVVPADRIRDLTRRHLYGSIENDLLNRPDAYSALLELREGDSRANQPSTGQVSELGLGRLLQMQPRTPGQSPTQTAAANRRTREEARSISDWITSNFVTEGENPQRLPMTQLQHDALVGLAMRSGRNWQDTLQELIPSARTGNWSSVASAVRAGGLTALEQPAPAGAQPPTPSAPAEPPPANAPATIRFYNPGGMYPGPSATRFGATGSQTIGGGHPIAVFPNPESGAAAQFDLLSRNYAGRSLQDIITRWSGGNSAPNYVSAVSRATGLSPDTVVTREMLSDPTVAIPFARAMADWEAGRTGSPLTEAQWQAGHAMAFGTTPPATGGPAGPAPRAPAPDERTTETADMLTGQAPAPRYAMLPPDRRRALITHLREAALGETRQGIEDDIQSIARTGRPQTLPDGTTWISRAPRVMVPNQAARVAQRVQEAYAQFNATRGLTDMTPEEMELRLDSLSPGRAETTGEGYAAAARVRDVTSRTIGRIQDLRTRDPALAVSGAQITGARSSVRADANGNLVNVPAEDDLRVAPAREVTDAFQLLRRRRPDLQIQVTESGEIVAAPAPGQADPNRMRPQTLLLTDPRLRPEDRAQIIEARVAAMARLGIPEENRPILRRDEAATLLHLPPNIATMNDTQFQSALRQAADRAQELFGTRYARAAYDAAVAFRWNNINQDRRQIAESTANRLGSGLTMTPRELNALAATRQIDREAAMWGGRYGTQEYGFGMPGYPASPTSDMLGLGPTYLPGQTTYQWNPDLQGPVSSPRIGPDNFVMPRSIQPSQTRETVATPGVTTSRRRPPPDEVTYLQNNPSIWREFDRDYGAGAAAAALGYEPQQRR